jgi:hypothetical protein
MAGARWLGVVAKVFDLGKLLLDREERLRRFHIGGAPTADKPDGPADAPGLRHVNGEGGLLCVSEFVPTSRSRTSRP